MTLADPHYVRDSFARIDSARFQDFQLPLVHNTIDWDTVTWLRTDGKREHENLCILLFTLLSLTMADPWLLTLNLPANRLRCSDCKAFQSITDFPFQRTGFRKLSCIQCKIRWANRRQRIQTQKTQQESSEGQVLADPPMIFCSSCNQQRPNTKAAAKSNLTDLKLSKQ
jgi:hypothetical protein